MSAERARALTSAEAAAVNAVDDEGAVRLLRDLVRARSVVPPDTEERAAGVVAE